MPDSEIQTSQTSTTSNAAWWKNPALYLALAAIGFTGWQYKEQTQQSRTVRQEIAKRLGSGEELTRQIKASVDKAQQQSEQTQQHIAQLENKIAEAENQYISLEALYQQLSNNPDEVALAEVEQNIGIANQQLQLASNPKAALIALQAADSRLARNDKPQWIALRKSINADIDKLKSLPHMDTVGMSLQLSNLAMEADSLPFIITSVAPEGNSANKSTQGFFARLWQDVQQLVRVRKIDAPDPALYSPTQNYFLRENLKLHLLSARLALLSRDEKSFRADIKVAQDMLAKYYDTQSVPVIAALDTLKYLSENVMDIAMPEISSSVDSIKRVRIVREKATIK
jgi:uroporphyrin-III C-methyltransferase